VAERSETVRSKTPGKTTSDTRVVIAQLMTPMHANTLGNVHGGWIMKLVDEAGALAAMRHAQYRVVTVALDQMTFKQPILIGDLVTISAEVSYTGTTSMECEVQVVAENPITGIRMHTNTAYLVYVALDERGSPVPVPALVAESEEEAQRLEEGRLRQEYRKRARKKTGDRQLQ
jgi:acyl-CoA hydrolase